MKQAPKRPVVRSTSLAYLRGEATIKKGKRRRSLIDKKLEKIRES